MKKILLPAFFAGMLLPVINAQETMQMISYYPTAYAQYKNIQTNTVDISRGGGWQSKRK